MSYLFLFGSYCFGFGSILVGYIIYIEYMGYFIVGSYIYDCFYWKVGVMCLVFGKVISIELVFGILFVFC